MVWSMILEGGGLMVWSMIAVYVLMPSTDRLRISSCQLPVMVAALH